MQQLSDILTLIDSYIGSSQWFVYLLLGTGLFFTIYLRFPQIRYFRHAIRVTSGRYDKDHHQGDTSHFGALATALSGTVGTGNIAGVALAIHLGGPAALFWMLVTALLGMTTKMVEVTLSHKYREKAADGTVSGGPMYYMKNRLNMKWLAAIFAMATIISSFGTGSLPQINSISNAFEVTFGINKIVTGVVLAVIMGLIILGGIKRIAKVTEKLVPFMTLLYFIGGVSVLIYNYDNIIPSVVSVFTDLFTGTAATGGFLGAGFAWAFNRGVNRGLFSNEAGQGSAPIAHAAARTDEPASEGIVATLEPFIDTVIICFMTGIILLSSGVWSEKVSNIFQSADTHIISGVYSENRPQDVEQLSAYYGSQPGAAKPYNGIVEVTSGVVANDVTILHNRSIASNVVVQKNNQPYTGALNIENGRIKDQVTLVGESLLHSAPLTTEAFGRGIFGSFGRYIIPFTLLLFAFSTALAWSYYGDRAVTYLFGVKWVNLYRVIYLIGFCIGAFVDTTLLWIFSGITITLMAIPNLIGILLLHKDMPKVLREYWVNFRRDFPNEKAPKKW